MNDDDEESISDGVEVEEDGADLSETVVELRTRLDQTRNRLNEPGLGAREMAVLGDFEARTLTRIEQAKERARLAARPTVTPAEDAWRKHAGILRMLFATLRHDAQKRNDWHTHDLARDALLAWPGEYPMAARARLTNFADLDASAIDQFIALVSEPTDEEIDRGNIMHGAPNVET